MDRHRFVVSREPVNRRTRPPTAQPAGSEPGGGRARAIRSRLELGLPLARQLRRAAPQRRIGATHVAALLVVMTWLLLATLPGSVPIGSWLIAACITVFVVGALLRRGFASPASPLPLDWLDDAVLQAFDRVLTACAADIEPRHLQRLREIKAAVVAIARSERATNAPLDADDRHYVVECLRRYLPDSLTAYLAVPRVQRLRCDPQAQAQAAASDLFGEQLQLMRDELCRCEARMARRASEGLLRQHRFLSSKRGSRDPRPLEQAIASSIARSIPGPAERDR